MNAHMQLRLAAERMQRLKEGGRATNQEIEALSWDFRLALSILAVKPQDRIVSFSDALASLKLKIDDLEVEVTGRQPASGQAGSASASSEPNTTTSVPKLPTGPFGTFNKPASYPTATPFTNKQAEPHTEVLLTACNQMAVFEDIQEIDAIFKGKVPGDDQVDQERFLYVKNRLADARRRCREGEYFSEKDQNELADLKRDARLCKDRKWPPPCPQQEAAAQGGSEEAPSQIGDDDESWADLSVTEVEGLQPLADIIAGTQHMQEQPGDQA